MIATTNTSTAKILHRHGGEITAITGIGHHTYNGVAEWYFIGNVRWQDGSQSVAREIGPNLVCYDDESPGSKERVHAAMAALSMYLVDQGEHHERKSKRDGRVYFWTPTKPQGRLEAQL